MGNIDQVHNVVCSPGATCHFGNQPQASPQPQPSIPWYPSGTSNIVSGGSSGSSGQTQCVTTCESNGSCKVKIVNGPPGKLAGSCFPPLFGGRCSGIPDKCTKGSKISAQCGSPCKAGTRSVLKFHNRTDIS